MLFLVHVPIHLLTKFAENCGLSGEESSHGAFALRKHRGAAQFVVESDLQGPVQAEFAKVRRSRRILNFSVFLKYFAIKSYLLLLRH